MNSNSIVDRILNGGRRKKSAGSKSARRTRSKSNSYKAKFMEEMATNYPLLTRTQINELWNNPHQASYLIKTFLSQRPYDNVVYPLDYVGEQEGPVPFSVTPGMVDNSYVGYGRRKHKRRSRGGDAAGVPDQAARLAYLNETLFDKSPRDTLSDYGYIIDSTYDMNALHPEFNINKVRHPYKQPAPMIPDYKPGIRRKSMDERFLDALQHRNEGNEASASGYGRRRKRSSGSKSKAYTHRAHPVHHKKKSAWNRHVSAVRRKHPHMSFSQAVKLASRTYKI